MIGYTCVGTNQLERAVAFYDDLLSLLGAKPLFKNDRDRKSTRLNSSH